MDPTIQEIDRKLDILRDKTDVDVINQITQITAVNGVDSEFVKEFMEYLVEKVSIVVYNVFTETRILLIF